MKACLGFTIFICISTITSGFTYNYNMLDYCSGYVVRTIDDDDVLYLQYNGNPLTAPTCSIGVEGKRNVDKYIICAYTDSFHFEDCGLNLELAEEVDRYKKIYSCNDSGPSTYCTLEQKNLHVVLHGKIQGNNSFSLRILAHKTYNHSANIALIIGLCVAGVLVLVVIIVVTIILVRRRRKRYAMDEDVTDTLMNQSTKLEATEVKSETTSGTDKPEKEETQSQKEKKTEKETTEKDESKPLAEATNG